MTFKVKKFKKNSYQANSLGDARELGNKITFVRKYKSDDFKNPEFITANILFFYHF